MLKSLPKISVVTVSYNQAGFIEQNIRAVIEQGYPNYEHIVVDGGSTDGTIEILKRYPHLIWSSEPDKGQTDALCKGFSRASGDIIAWINSDDYYAPGALHAAAQALQNAELALGPVQVIDGSGNHKELVPNIARTRIDLLKYWVQFSSPAQQGVFFTRALLERARRADGTLLDTDLQYCMDFELWLRLSQFAELTTRIPTLCGFFRVHERSKTGSQAALFTREVRRVYQRFLRQFSGAERTLSFVIPVGNSFDGVGLTLESLMQLSLPDWEVLLVSTEPAVAGSAEHRASRRAALELDQQFSSLPIRWLEPSEAGLVAALAEAARAACSPLLGVLFPGQSLSSEGLLSVLRTFAANDSLGVGIPARSSAPLVEHLFGPEKARQWPNLDKVITTPRELSPFFARTVALREIAPNLIGGAHPLLMSQLLLWSLARSWAVLPLEGVAVEGAVSSVTSTSVVGVEADLFAAQLAVLSLAKIADSYEQEPFSGERVRLRQTLEISSEIAAQMRKVREATPPNWQRQFLVADLVELSETLKRFPEWIVGQQLALLRSN